jgi:chemotaxis protein CheD
MRQHFVGIAEMKISSDPEDVLIAPNLGSCLGIAVYDQIRKRGGLIHCLLPLSKADPEKAAKNPFMYVDTGVTALLENLLSEGADRKQLSIVVIGGANINDESNVFEIGKRNYTVLKKILWKNNLLVRSENVGECVSRTLSLHIENGKTLMKVNGKTFEL